MTPSSGDVAHRRTGERAIGQRVAVDSAGDLDRARLEPLDRVMPPWCPKRNFVGLCAKRPCQQLMARQIPNNGDRVEPERRFPHDWPRAPGPRVP